MANSDLERRVQVLEDMEAIRCLKSEHYRAVDTRDVELFVSLYTDDAIWESGIFGRVEGIEALRRLAEETPSRLEFSVHYVTNSSLVVEGDEARGRWYGLVAGVLAANGLAVWGGTVVHEKYARVGGAWKIRQFSQEPQFWTPFDQGWAKQRFVDQVYGWADQR